MFKVKDKRDCRYSRLDITEAKISQSIDTAIKYQNETKGMKRTKNIKTNNNNL